MWERINNFLTGIHIMWTWLLSDDPTDPILDEDDAILTTPQQERA